MLIRVQTLVAVTLANITETCANLFLSCESWGSVVFSVIRTRHYGIKDYGYISIM